MEYVHRAFIRRTVSLAVCFHCLIGLNLQPTLAAERDIQFNSIDFTTNIIELHNFGATDQDLSGWRLCSHSDDNGEFRYTAATGFNGVSIEAGTSLFLWVDNDGPADADNVNIGALGGAFASTLDQDAYSIGFYWPNGGSLSFGLAEDLADHLQWNLDGADNTSADARSGVAETAGLWSDADEWISTTLNTTRIELTDLTGGLLHSPADYDVIQPSPADFDGDGDVDSGDLSDWEAAYGVDDGADANGDGRSDALDFFVWQRELGVQPLSAVTAVPEPQTLSLCLCGLLIFGFRKRRTKCNCSGKGRQP